MARELQCVILNHCLRGKFAMGSYVHKSLNKSLFWICFDPNCAGLKDQCTRLHVHQICIRPMAGVEPAPCGIFTAWPLSYMGLRFTDPFISHYHIISFIIIITITTSFTYYPSVIHLLSIMHQSLIINLSFITTYIVIYIATSIITSFIITFIAKFIITSITIIH